MSQPDFPGEWVTTLRARHQCGRGRALSMIAAYLERPPYGETDRRELDALPDADRRVDYMRRRWGAGWPVASMLYSPTNGSVAP